MASVDLNEIIGLEGVIVNFRIGNKNPRIRQLIIRFDDLPPRLKIDNLIGRTIEVVWKSKKFRGRIYRRHGKNAVRAIFKKGLPGQVLGSSRVYIVK